MCIILLIITLAHCVSAGEERLLRYPVLPDKGRAIIELRPRDGAWATGGLTVDGTVPEDGHDCGVDPSG